MSRESALVLAARSKLRHAISKGLVVRPDQCERCGCVPPKAKDGRGQIHGHHHDYSKPLEVEWLCVYCHRKETPPPDWEKNRDRLFKAIGESNGQSKLTENDVVSSIRLRSQGWSYRAIGARFCVDHKTIMRACKGEQWKHIASAPQPPKENGE